MKKCFICKLEKEIDCFYKHKGMSDGHLNKCKFCCKLYQKNRDTKEIDKKRYRNSIKRILHSRYLTMSQRVSGKFGIRRSTGKEIVSKEAFISWSYNQIDRLKALHEQWAKNNYERNFSPSIDRIDSNKGYTLDNMQWITSHENTCKR